MNSSDSSRKQIFGDFDFFLFYQENICCVYSLESPHRDDSNENTTYHDLYRNCQKAYKLSPFCFLTWRPD